MGTIKRVLLTGATGFVGSHVFPVLARACFEVRGATRDVAQAAKRFPGREFVHLDTGQPSSLGPAMRGCDAAIYLVHSMAAGGHFDDVERDAATSFARAAHEAGLQRIVYLGGVRPQGKPSRHLQSRLQTGENLRAGPVPTIELQASMIIGAGSESFRIVRDLSARLPVMVLPSWLDSRTEPVAIDDVTAAIAHALTIEHRGSAAYALPGPDLLTCREILERTARQLGHEPRMWGVSFVSPHLSTYWIALVTRADVRIARQLVEGLRGDLIAPDAGFWRLFPEHRRLSFDEALRRALPEEERGLSRRARLVEHLLGMVAPHVKRAAG